MDLYNSVLFVHVASSLALLACLGAMTLCEIAAARAPSLNELRASWGTANRIAVGLRVLTLLLLLSGPYLAYLRGLISQPWVSTSVIILVFLAATGPLVTGKRLNAALDAANAAGSITPEVTRILGDPVLALLVRLRITLITELVLLMTNKPGLGVTVGVTIAAVVVALATGARTRKVHVAAEETA